MPNHNNIEAPITLVGFGRSGTSLISNIFARHPDCHSVNETTNLIFGIWDTLEFSAGLTPPLVRENTTISSQERAARVVRQTFLTCFPNKCSTWFHKPIGIPRVITDKLRLKQWSEIAGWYWDVMQQVFPRARYFTVLRNPCDVVLSVQSRSGLDPAIIWKRVALMAFLLTHPTCPVDYAIHFEELVKNKEKVVQDLLEFLDLPFQKQVLDAFNQVHVPSPGRERLTANLATRRHEWKQLDPIKTCPNYLNYIGKLFDRFGYPLEIPPHFTEEKLGIEKEPEHEDLERIISTLQEEIATSARRDYAARIQKLTEQRQYWQRLAKERQKQIIKLKQNNI